MKELTLYSIMLIHTAVVSGMAVVTVKSVCLFLRLDPRERRLIVPEILTMLFLTSLSICFSITGWRYAWVLLSK